MTGTSAHDMLDALDWKTVRRLVNGRFTRNRHVLLEPVPHVKLSDGHKQNDRDRSSENDREWAKQETKRDDTHEHQGRRNMDHSPLNEGHDQVPLSLMNEYIGEHCPEYCFEVYRNSDENRGN